MSGKRVTHPSVVQQFRQKAAALQAMAGAATDKGPFVKRNLERLAARFRTIAAQLAAELRAPERTRVRRPGAIVLYEGLYQELNMGRRPGERFEPRKACSYLQRLTALPGGWQTEMGRLQ
jgi:hypothetical protein